MRAISLPASGRRATDQSQYPILGCLRRIDQLRFRRCRRGGRRGSGARAAFSCLVRLHRPQQRFDALDFVGTEIPRRRAELGELLGARGGQDRRRRRPASPRGAGQIFKFFAGEALRTGGRDSFPRYARA